MIIFKGISINFTQASEFSIQSCQSSVTLSRRTRLWPRMIVRSGIEEITRM